MREKFSRPAAQSMLTSGPGHAGCGGCCPAASAAGCCAAFGLVFRTVRWIVRMDERVSERKRVRDGAREKNERDAFVVTRTRLLSLAPAAGSLVLGAALH